MKFNKWIKEKRSIPFSLLFFLFLLNCVPEVNPTEVYKHENELQTKIDSLKTEINELKSIEKYWYLEDYDGIILIENGISNPEHFIDSSIRTHSDLIPLKAVLGGTMLFRETKLIGDRWVLADYEDGHIYGIGLFEYSLSNDKKLEFKLLNSFQPE